MKMVPATRAKNVLGQVFDDACSDLVMIERHGKEQIALMPANEARIGVLSSYAVGSMSRSTAMKRLGLSWYGQLTDAMRTAGLKVNVDTQKENLMVSDVEQLLGVKS